VSCINCRVRARYDRAFKDDLQLMPEIPTANQVVSLNSSSTDDLDIQLLVLDIDGSATRSL